MGPSRRRFQNLILENRFTGAKSLRSVDLTRQLFGNTAPPSKIKIGDDGGSSSTCQTSPAVVDAAGNPNPKSEQAAAAALEMKTMRRIRVPVPIFTYEAAPRNQHQQQQGKIDCFPFAERTTFWADHLGRTFFFDAERRQMEMVPDLHSPKRTPFSLFVLNVDADCDCNQYLHGSSFFVMEKAPSPEPPEANSGSTPGSSQFEAFVYRKPTKTSYFKSWHCQIVPPPPFVRELKHWQHSCRRPEIDSYAVVSAGDGDSRICISVEGVGSYCLDTARYEWSKAGEWTLPFHGRVDYVPELNLWLGFTTESERETRHLAAADLSDMESPPQLVGSWKEPYLLPEEWKACKDPQLVNLGSGRFCIVRFFRSTPLNGDQRSENLAVFTGVELSPTPSVQDVNGGSGNVQLQMMSHKSLCYVSNDTTIDSVF